MSSASIPPPARPNNSAWPGYFDLLTWTHVPDILITFWLPQLSGSELKVVLYVVRHTFGYHREAAPIPFEQFLAGRFARDGRRLDWGAGVSKRQLRDSLSGLVECGILTRRRHRDARGGDTASSYALHIAGSEIEPGPKPTDYGAPAPYAFTPVPNQVFDVLLPHLKERQLKTLLYITHHTSGLKRRCADISRAQMLRGTITLDHHILDRGVGISEPSLDAALRDLVQLGVIFREEQRSPEGAPAPTRYGLHVRGGAEEVPQESAPPLPQDSAGEVPKDFAPPLPQHSAPHVKEHGLKTHEREIHPHPISFKPFQASPLDSRQAWATVLMSLRSTPGADAYLRGSSLLAREGGDLIIGISSAYGAEWLERRLGPRAVEALSAVGGERVGVRFVAENAWRARGAGA